MNKISMLLLSLGLVAAAIPFALAEEDTKDYGRANCEDRVTWHSNETGQDETTSQPWIGYTQTESARTLYEGLGSPGGLRTCEGEHWDGQDSVRTGENNNNADGCLPNVDANSVAWCMTNDPNNGGADPTTNGRPVSIRVSQKADTSGSVELYVASDIALVGRAVLYEGVCQNGASGLEGDASCSGGSSTGVQDRSATYLRDNTPGDVLATVVSATGLTKGHAGEADCDQSTYQTGAENVDKSQCERDNTAITIDLLP